MTQKQLVQVIRRRMTKIDMTPYRLHEALHGKVAKQAVYNFLEHGRNATTKTLVAIMTVLKLSISEPDE